MGFSGAKKAREVVYSVLRDACVDGDLSISEALEAVKDIFADNAKEFYKINVAVKSVNLENAASPHFLKVATEGSQQDVALVRILWVDTSGQHRCRVRHFPFSLSPLSLTFPPKFSMVLLKNVIIIVCYVLNVKLFVNCKHYI